jgi:type IV pilus assembly protein PilM
MAKIQAVWAIDIGQSALKALKLVPGENPDQVVAEAFDFIEYPKILSQPDADPDELVREALATFTDRNDIKGCKVAIAVPGQSGLVKFIKLPPVEKKRIPDIVKFEAKQQIPFALDEVVWAYQQIGDDDEVNEEEFTMAEVGLFAMKRDQINRSILPFAVGGIEVEVVQMSPLALYNFIAFDQLKGSGSKDSVVLLDIGADNTDLIITDGNRIWQRNVPIGGNHFTRALTKELKQTFAKAEHLKRNATKAPDPRAIFTAMRGVFNDFASEVNRSIGFYSSINRTAKIRKVVGLGNGFKLPGLQKFLQQNLNQEVDRLETFDKLVGDEVKGAPQFQDNLASFAVAYGLGVQGLGKGGLSTNLLPPEIERVRLIRSKKPWALAASALIMLGLTFLFTAGDYRVLASVTTTPFQEAVKQANTVTERGRRIETDFNKAKDEWKSKFSEGMALTGGTGDRALWPQFLTVVSQFFPDPVQDYHFDDNDPLIQDTIDKLEVHIDAIKPVWRQDVKEWFDALETEKKMLMHPLDANTPPSGEGWIIQIICHHYNPYPTSSQQLALPSTDPKRFDFGPIQFLTEKVLSRLNSPALRLFGVSHVAVSWMTTEKDWTTEKGKGSNNLASRTVPLLERASAPAATEGGGAGGAGVAGGGGRMGEAMRAMMGGMGSGRSGMARGGMGGMDGMRAGMMGMRMMGMPGMQGNDAEMKKQLKLLTRTDFLIQFVWKPVKAEERPKNPEERNERLKSLLADLKKAEEKNPAVRAEDIERQLESASRKKSDQLDSQITNAVGAGGGAAPGAGGAPAAAGAPAMPVPGGGGTPVPPGGAVPK